ncbi:TAXI family TRAP transporter solute-binding subunit [Nocardia callitridis]|uniref:TAXI family TRAP transporter solute-binding subunit n=1 Tax=Nocardia callitridis TaxID=648753 RepID=A0ABP9L0H9_9NOCA
MNRRRLLMLGAAGAVLAGCADGSSRTPVRLAAGEAGGFYHAFAGLVVAAAERAGKVRIERLTTSGSRENLRLLADGRADVALTLSDSVGEATSGAFALGRVYENYLQLVVRADSTVRAVGDLRGTRVSLGADGSGAASTGARMLWAAGLDPANDVVASHHPLEVAVRALAAGEIDALLWAGGVPTRLFDIPARMRLVSIGELTGPMRERFGPAYDHVQIPADVYPGGAAVQTIGVANLLLAAASLGQAQAAAIVELLLYEADSLVPNEAAGTQFLDGRSLITTGSVPLHPGAAAVYREWHG